MARSFWFQPSGTFVYGFTTALMDSVSSHWTFGCDFMLHIALDGVERQGASEKVVQPLDAGSQARMVLPGSARLVVIDCRSAIP